MRFKVQNSFLGGLDTDTNVANYKSFNYYDAENLRLVSNDTLVTGALTNILAPSFKRNFPINEAGNIIGKCQIRNTTVLFVKGVSNDYILSTTIDEDGSTSTSLVYSDELSTTKLNFDTDYPIDAVGRYEAEDIQKVYWCDYLNENRFLNLAEDYMNPSTTEAIVFSLAPSANLPNPKIVEIGSSGNLSSGKICYYYQLYRRNGNETGLSPGSHIIPLSSKRGSSVGEFRGDEVGVNTGNSVSLSFTGLDTNFDRIRIYSVFYADVSADPIITAIVEQDYGDGETTYIDTGVSSLFTLTPEEFSVILGRVFKSKTLETKNNYLIAGNIKEERIDVDFDARAYRFDRSSTSATLYEEAAGASPTGNIIILDTSGSWTEFEFPAVPVNSGTNWNIPETYNTINLVNDFDRDQENIGNNYPIVSGTPDCFYLPSSTLLGGKGPNISYSFINTLLEGNKDSTAKSSPYLREINGPTNSLIDPIVVGEVTGYKRNEVYRFGIEFQFKNGQKSFVKWIGDIRFPPYSNTTLPINNDYTGIDGTIRNNQLGIRFSVDISVIRSSQPEVYDNLAGFRIVRVERTEADKNILFQGIGGCLLLNSAGDYSFDSKIGSVYAYDNGISDVSDVDLGLSYVSNRTAITDWLEMISPEPIINNSINITSGTKLYAVGIQNVYAGNLAQHTGTGDNGLFRTRNYYADTTSSEINIIADVNSGRMSFLSEYGATSSFLGGNSTYFRITTPHSNAGGVGTDSYRARTPIIELDSPFDTTNMAVYRVPTRYDVFALDVVNNKYGSQYGGLTYEARSRNTYIPTVMYQDLNVGNEKFEMITIEEYEEFENITGFRNYDTRVYGGDTHVVNFDYMRSYWDKDVPAPDQPQQEYITFPVETSVNLEYRRDEIVKYYTGFNEHDATGDNNPDIYKLQETQAKGIIEFPDNYPTDLTDLYLYNDAYSREKNTITNQVKPFDFSADEIFDTLVISSGKKINGELIDSWTKFDYTTFIEVDSSYGEIEKLLTHKDILYYFQNTGLGRLAVNDRYIIGQGTSQLSLGTGNVLERYDYLNTSYGISRLNSTISTENTIYYISELDKSIRSISDNSPINLSRRGNVTGLVNSLLPSTNLVLGYDERYREVYFTFDDTTLIFNENINKFTSRYHYHGEYNVGHLGFYTECYIDHPLGIYVTSFDFSEDGSTNILSLRKLNDRVDDVLGGYCSVKVLIHPDGSNVFNYDVLDIRTQVFENPGENYPTGTDEFDKTVTSIDYNNIYQSESVNLSFNNNTGNIRRRGRIWRTRVPLTSDVSDPNKSVRFADNYLLANLVYNNSDIDNFIIHDLTTYVRSVKV